MRNTANCIVCISDSSMTIVGPFSSHERLVEWGESWQRVNGDDPRWQSVYLPDPDAMPTRIRP